MPSFEDMKKQQSQIAHGSLLKSMSNNIVNELFSNATDYRNGKIYDANMVYLNDIDFKFMKKSSYTINKDQVEYIVQFRPGVNPEIDFDITEDQKHRLGYYLDILDENSNIIEKWLVLGIDTAEFKKYIVLKCNWTFEWLDRNRKYHKCLGCVRDRNNYNSGVNKCSIHTLSYTVMYG